MTAVSARDGGPVADLDASQVPAPDRRRRGSGFWVVAFAFLIVMAVATLPSPLYGLYRTRDHLSALTITVVFAIFAGGTIATLQGDSSLTTRQGTTGIVLGGSPPESRVAMTSDLLIALYVGLAVPVIGAGVALSLGASAPNTVLGFAILVGLGVAVSGWVLLRPPRVSAGGGPGR